MRWLPLALAGWMFATTALADQPAEAVRPAITKGLRRLEQGAANYVKNRQCFSCHHQALTLLNLTAAKKRGFDVEPTFVRQQIDFTVETFAHKRVQVSEGRAVPGANTMAAYALHTLEVARHPADETTMALVKFLLVRQGVDGAWPALMSRPPSEGSSFTNAALALQALRTYGKTDDAALAGRVETAFKRGREWLRNHQPVTTEDKVFHLRGLVYLADDREAITAARANLLREQRTDGNWAQLPELAGDAYATGAVLVALRTAGLSAEDAAYRKGVQYLLRTQQEDGSWLVTTRSRPVQTFFDNGDPGGKSQFISFAATGWAVLALLESLPVR